MLRKTLLRQRLAQANDSEDLTTGGSEILKPENSDLETSNASLLLPSPDKGILMNTTEENMQPPTKKKTVSFADGIKPGEGTSPSGGEDHPLSPPPLIRKLAKKRKKRKVKVRIIRVGNNTKEDESEEDDLSPPPPPPGTPPPEAYQITAAGRYLYPVTPTSPFQGSQDAVFPSLPTTVPFSTTTQQR